MIDATGSSALGRELTALECVPAVVAMLVASVPQPEREAHVSGAAPKALFPRRERPRHVRSRSQPRETVASTI